MSPPGIAPLDHEDAPLDRSLAFDGCVNFRDLGGYRTSDGLTVGWRRLFRADGLHRLSEADHLRLIELGVTTVIDLRTVDEAEQRGRFPVDQVPVRYVDLPLMDVLPAMEEFLALVRHGYGSYEGLAEFLGVAEAVDRMRRAVLVAG